MENGTFFYDYPMKWHKFLICFSLWAGALLNVISGIGQMTGLIYQGFAADVYRTFPNMRGIDLVFGAAMLALAVYQIVTRFALARLKANAPGMIVTMYAIMAVLQTLYVAAASVTLGAWAGDSSTVVAIAVAVIFAVANRAYYQRRAELFVN